MREGEFAYTEAVRALSRSVTVDLDRLLATVSSTARNPVVYLADFSRQTLFPLSPGLPAEDVAGTLAGRAYTTGETVTSPGDGEVRVWVPVTEQTARVGVLAVSFPGPSAGGGPAEPGTVLPGTALSPDVRQAQLLGVFAGLIVAAMTRVSDHPADPAAGAGHVAAGVHAVGPVAAMVADRSRRADLGHAGAGL